jgi:pimeloyl-ACP methyl ester carboxylesterase
VLTLSACSVGEDGDEEPEAASSSGATASVEESVAASSADVRPTTLAEYEDQEIDWGSCEDFDPPEGATSDGFECGYLLVPLDYGDPAGATVEIAVARRPARDESRGALVVNPGGPGGSGVDYAFNDTFAVSADVVAEYDLVGLDPRGVSRSEGVDCLDDEEVDDYLAADVTPDTASEEAVYQAVLDRLARGCGTQDPVAAAMGTENAARDIDVLRAALGEDELNWLGKSYGTLLGAVYAELFPENVGRMVLDGAVDPEGGLTGSQAAVEQIGGFELALESFVEDCLPRDGCPLSATVDEGVGQVVRFIERLDVAPLPTGDEERPLTQGLAVYGVFAPLYQRDAWPILREALAQGFEGDAATLLALADLYSQRDEDGTFRGNSIEALPAVSCLDADPDAPEEDPDEVQRALEAEAPALGSLFDVRFEPCENWPFPAAGLPGISPEGVPPILVIGTTRDPATPYEWAERLSDALPRSVLLTYEGDGHTAYLTSGSQCVDAVVDEFLLDGDLPREGTTCVAEYE